MAVIKVPDNMGGWIEFPALRGKRGPRGYEGIQGPRGESFSVDDQGTLNERDNFDLQPKGYSYLDVENGNLYIKRSSVHKDWSPPIPFGKGEKGETGAKGDKGEDGLDGESIVNINPASSIGQVRMWIGTQEQYDAQAPFDNDVLIVIVG